MAIRMPTLGSWLMRTTALSAAVLISSLPLLIAERLGAPDNPTLALAQESGGQATGPDDPVNVEIPVDLTLSDLHVVSVVEFTGAVEALAEALLTHGLDSSEIAIEIGRALAKNSVSPSNHYTDAETATLLANTSVIVAQHMDGALPSMPSWRDLVQLGYDEIAAPATETPHPATETPRPASAGSDYERYAELYAEGYDAPDQKIY